MTIWIFWYVQILIGEYKYWYGKHKNYFTDLTVDCCFIRLEKN